MRVLLIHADRFAFRVTDKTAVSGFVEEPASNQLEIDDVLVCFVAVEAGDEPDPIDVARQAATEVHNTAQKVGAVRVVVYPYAHLSSDLAKPRLANEVIDEIVRLLSANEDLDVHRAPFGYYKSYDISCKGHPLSELAMTLVPSAASGRDTNDVGGSAGLVSGESQALVAERNQRSEWRICQPDGSFCLAEDFDFDTDQGLKDLFAYEREGSRVAEEAPPHIKLMREQELVDYEPGSDAGNMRWYPKGLVVKRLLEEHVTRMVVDYGAMEVETPVMYDYGHPGLAKYLNRFPARQYVVKSDDKDFFLRFAACFGQYLILHDMAASYRDLPVRLYELTHYSFRREQGGEVAGLRRLRTFTMPDMHSLVRDMRMAKAEFLKQVSLCMQWLEDIDVECVPAIRFVRSFIKEQPEFVRDLMEAVGRQVV